MSYLSKVPTNASISSIAFEMHIKYCIDMGAQSSTT